MKTHLVFLFLFVCTGAAPFSLQTINEDTVQFCVGKNCTTVAYVPSMTRTSISISTYKCAGEMRVFYDCDTLSGAIDECPYIEHVLRVPPC